MLERFYLPIVTKPMLSSSPTANFPTDYSLKPRNKYFVYTPIINYLALQCLNIYIIKERDDVARVTIGALPTLMLHYHGVTQANGQIIQFLPLKSADNTYFLDFIVLSSPVNNIPCSQRPEHELNEAKTRVLNSC